MYVFNYHPTNFAYTGGTPCDFDQFEPGSVILPAWSSKNAPPKHDSAVEWPYYVAATDSWDIRPLPLLQRAVEPEAAPTPSEQFDNLQARIDAHLQEAQRLLSVAKAEAGA